MRRNRGPGKFIVIEGLDGAGTTTQARLLGERLAERGAVWVTQEPTTRPVGQLIRRILAGDLEIDPRSLALLFAADRVDHVYHPQTGIVHRLAQGEHVVGDRYYLSSLTYQTLDAGFSWVYRINDRVLRPDLTIFVHVPVVLCMERIGVRQGERKELFERQEALEQVLARYCRAIEQLQAEETIQIVDGSGPIPEIAERIWCRVEALFDPTLLTSRPAQRRLARQQDARFLSALQRLLQQRQDLFLRGMRFQEGGITLEIDVPTRCQPVSIRFERRNEGWELAKPRQGHASDTPQHRAEELGQRALEEAGRD